VLDTTLDSPGLMTWHEAAPPTEERLPAAPTTARSWQTAAGSPTRLATLAAIPPETPVSTTQTPAEGTTEAEAGACTSTASRTTR